jgi:hypothetical protein
MNSPVFATTVYGSHYLTFLVPHLYSVVRSHPTSRGVVFWCDVPSHEIALLERAFPGFEFHHANQSIEGSVEQRIPLKLRHWVSACELYPDSFLCLLDCDTILVKPIDRFFHRDFDVVFTWKDERWPINTGVLLIKNRVSVRQFMREWLSQTEHIVAVPRSLSNALECSGAADQHAFRELVGFGEYDRVFQRAIAGNDVVFRGAPCRVLNETNCVPITEETHVIHYKGGWHNIILKGAPFTEHRPEVRCREMFEFWRQVDREANEALARAIAAHACRNHVDEFRQVSGISYEEYGILHSEMLAVCALCDELNVDVIVESGRCRGQSTLVLANYFQNKPTRIISIELERDENAKFAEKRLSPYSTKVELRYGDSCVVMPRLIRKLKGGRVAILLDGPKSQVAVDLVKELLGQADNIVAIFLHDTRRGTPPREIVQRSFARVFFTDSEEYVESYSSLDLPCLPQPDAPITVHTWRPYSKGNNRIMSYGPTLAVIFPLPRQDNVNQEATTRHSGGPVRLFYRALRRFWNCLRQG